MAIQKEVGLKVSDWMGVNRQETREQLQDQFYWTLQNLYERKIGELQRRGGAQLYSNTTLPSNITSLDQDFILYDKILGKTKLIKVGCDGTHSTKSITNANVTMSFVTDATAHWGNSSTGITNGFSGCTSIQLVAVGFGKQAPLNSALTVGLPVSGDTKKLQVVIAGGGIGDTNITGIEVYASVIYSYSSGIPLSTWIWVGHIDVVNNPTGTFTFKYGPITLGADPTGTGEVGGTDTTFTVTQASSVGSFQVGKTYYVALLAHRMKFDDSDFTNARSYWYAKSVQSITIGAVNSNQNTSISVAKSAGGSAATLLCIGTHPQLLRPYGIIGYQDNFSVTITALPAATTMGVVKFTPTSSTINDGTYSFVVTDMGTDEMFMYLDTNSNWIPVPINNFNGYNVTSNWPFFLAPWTYFDGTTLKTVSTGASWSGVQYFSQTQELLYLSPVSGWNSYNFSGLSPNTVTHNLVHSDGSCASMAVMDYGCANPPKFSYVGVYQEHLTGSGGSGIARNQLYFSNVLAPYNWGVPGAASVAQYVQCESTGEDIIGHGTYTNTANLGGPIEQILVTKRSSLWVLTSLPTYTSSANNSATFIELSRKAGCANIRTFAQTELGAIIAGIDNVWLVRGSGEPTPIGDEIKYFLRSEDPTQTVDPTNWNAVYHDGHYKLAFSSPGSSVANQELWLNIEKMKKLKGQPCWYGPMVGRECSRSMVETQFNDTIIPKRWSVDLANKRWYQADREDFVTDFGTSLSFLLESKIFGMKDDALNKLFLEQMWKIKADANFSFTETLVALNELGEITDTNARAVTKMAGYATSNYANFVNNCRAKISRYFPANRGLFGENIKASWSYTGDVYFTIAMFAIFYKEVRRRPGLSGG